jgi:hypothetical protein
MDRLVWAPVVERFLEDLCRFPFPDWVSDARENIKFFGGHFGRRIHQRFPGSVCVLSIECKKVFMNEWNGDLDRAKLEMIHRALQSTVAGVLEVLDRW